MGSIGPATPAHTKLWQCAADILQAGTESLKPDHPLRTCGDEMNRVSGEHYNKAEMELHPGFFLTNVGDAAIGEMILIKDTGPECLIKYPANYMEH